MQINNVVFICCAFFSGYAMQAMELVPLVGTQKSGQKGRIQERQDIAKLSFEDIKPWLVILPEKKRNEITSQLKNSLTFNVALLPSELRYCIIDYMLDRDGKSAEIFYKTPLFYAFKKYDEATKEVEKLFLSKEKTEKLIATFFRMSVEKKNMISNVINPSFITKIVYGGSVVNKEEYEAIQLDGDASQEELFAGKDISLLEGGLDSADIRCFSCMSAFIGGIVTTMGGFFISLPIVIKFDIGPYGFASLLVLAPVGTVLGGVVGYMVGGRNIRRSAKKIGI